MAWGDWTVLLDYRHSCERTAVFAPMVDQTIDDLIRTGLIAKEQCWRKNSHRGCLLFSLRGNENKNRNATKGEVRPLGGIRDMSGWRMQ